MNEAHQAASHRSLDIPVLGTLARWFRRARSCISRSDWGRRILRRRAEQQDAGDGLILIQIDGLARQQFEVALKNGTMPFLRRLLAREHYELRSVYSGVPSTTSAVQAELFFGVRSAVPAHAFVDRKEGRIVTMLESEKAKDVESRVQKSNSGLLEGGSAYSNIYSGGAKDAYFCASAMGWGDLWHGVHPVRIAAFAVLHFESMLRIVGQAVVELGLGIGDCFRGLSKWVELRESIKFLPSRVGVAVVLRELITIAAGVDASAGVPVIQLNFLGYDEHAHRRGPDSRFAHWTLRGIDRCIRRVWKAASRSERRHYQVWIYSDHGQERVAPFDVKTGRPITDVVREAFAPFLPGRETIKQDGTVNPLPTRAAFLKSAPRLQVAEEKPDATTAMDDIIIAAIGPIGHISLPAPIPLDQMQAGCQYLAGSGQVPAVLMAGGPGQALAWTAEGQFSLPADAARVLGQNHPFLSVATQDLIRVCHHPEAGDVIILGWRDGVEPLSFVFEKGAHGGVATQETHAFALIPSDTAIESARDDFARPEELRQAAMQVLGRTERKTRRKKRSLRETVRVMTYNVHSCVGLDGRLSISRVARVLAQCDADVIALQELDVQKSRTGFGDQAFELAQKLGMAVHFHPAFSIAMEQYGDAILSRLPTRLVRASSLPADPSGRRGEPRGALWVEVDCGDWELQLINTHLGLRSLERLAQVEELLGSKWIGSPQCRGPTVLCGDLNAGPASVEYRRLTERFRDVQRLQKGSRPRNTWYSTFPTRRIWGLKISRETINPRTPALREGCF